MTDPLRGTPLTVLHVTALTLILAPMTLAVFVKLGWVEVPPDLLRTIFLNGVLGGSMLRLALDRALEVRFRERHRVKPDV
jgi:hypothetical protein